MLTAERVLLLAAAALLAHAGLVLGFCTTDTKGDIHANPVQLRDVTLQPPTPGWNIMIPEVQGCVKVGVMVTCCDEEAPPRVVVGDRSSATVVRTGPVLVPAFVKTVVFCRNYLYSAPHPRHRPHPQPQLQPQTPGWISA